MDLPSLLQRLPDHMGDMLVVADTRAWEEGGPRILYVNEAYTRISGYAAEEVIGKPPLMLGSIHDAEQQARIAQALAQHEAITFELLDHAPNGRTYWAEYSITPVLDATGHADHIMILGRDVTERRIMQDAVEKQSIAFLHSDLRNRAILYSIIDGIVTFTPEGQIESLSPAAERMFGYDVMDIETMHITALFPEAVQDEIRGWLSDPQPPAVRTHTLDALHSDGAVFTADINLSRIRLGERYLYVMAVRDVTALKQAQAKAREQTERVALLQEAAPIVR